MKPSSGRFPELSHHPQQKPCAHYAVAPRLHPPSSWSWGTCILCSICTNLPLPDTLHKWNYTIFFFLFLASYFTLPSVFKAHLCVACIWTSLFLQPNNISLHVLTTFCLAIDLLMEKWVVSTICWWILWIMLLWIVVYGVCVSPCFQFLWVTEFLDHIIAGSMNSEEPPNCFPQALHHFISMPAVLHPCSLLLFIVF